MGQSHAACDVPSWHRQSTEEATLLRIWCKALAIALVSLGGERAIDDMAVGNDDAWRHSVTKYLREPVLCRALQTLLKV